ncbi:MAG: Gfo/Idh/MocA family oxidoreductase [Acetatifactor sp.]|nr:Gfo/Idh/MocA family oxidoreductase [Acetatifactor sp.]
MEKYRFIIVGSGWRSLYYVRIAKALPQHFELCAMLCRTQEKADKMASENGIYTTTSVEECVGMKPDFVVVVVNKASIADVSKEWMARGVTVLCETPASLELTTLKELWALKEQGGKLSVAEQYTRYPIYQALLKILDRGLIGDPYAAVVSLAHEYHGASLIRAFLKEGMTPFQVMGKTYSFPTAETMSRYEQFTDGRLADKKRTAAVFEFADGKVVFYDFDSEQYRSPIRHNYVNVRGARGELRDESFFYLDDRNLPTGGTLVVSRRGITVPEENNPNLCQIEEITGITYQGEDVYTPPFGLCGLPSDETAIAQIMFDTGAYARGEKKLDYSLENALQDAYMAILLQQATISGQTIKSEEQPWHQQ